MLTSDKKLSNCKDIRKLPLVEIVWHDSAAGGGWNSLSSYRNEKKTLQIRTVGWLTKNTNSEVQVVQSISQDGKVADSMTIPRVCIRKTRRLR